MTISHVFISDFYGNAHLKDVIVISNQVYLRYSSTTSASIYGAFFNRDNVSDFFNFIFVIIEQLMQLDPID